MEKSPKIFLNYVHPGMVYHQFMLSVLGLLASDRYEVVISNVVSGPLISRPRNELVARFLTTDCTHFLSVDTDMIFNVSHLTKLIEDDLPIVSGHYQKVNEDGTELMPVGVLWKPDGRLNRATYETISAQEGIVEVAGVGMGFTLVKREVLIQLQTSVLWPFAEILTEKGQPVGEDVTFCLRAKEIGFQSYIDMDCKVGHAKTVILGM